MARIQSLSSPMRYMINQTMTTVSHQQVLANKNHQSRLYHNNQQILKKAIMLILNKRTSSQPIYTNLLSNKLTSLQ
jgi:hypothetical protein